ncbi:MAG: hypothetical protein R3212_01210 [Xanthomonadales bacterium]|nr:hypothetical protein [Xanthomonadales bacterium]
MKSNSRIESYARWFLAVAYGLGSLAFASAEALTGIFSARFDYTPEFLYFVSAVQFGCAVLLARNKAVLPALFALTVMSLGAVFSHFRIGSPLTSVPSLGFTALQVWYGLRVLRPSDSVSDP